jgi:hypothetical protein
MSVPMEKIMAATIHQSSVPAVFEMMNRAINLAATTVVAIAVNTVQMTTRATPSLEGLWKMVSERCLDKS